MAKATHNRAQSASSTSIAKAETELLFACRRGRREEPAIRAMVEALGLIWPDRADAAT